MKIYAYVYLCIATRLGGVPNWATKWLIGALLYIYCIYEYFRIHVFILHISYIQIAMYMCKVAIRRAGTC